MEAGNCTCIKLVKVLLKKLQNDLFKVLYVPWITAYNRRVGADTRVSHYSAVKTIRRTHVNPRRLQWIFLKGVEYGGEIALAGVGQESDDALALVLGTLGYLGGGKGGGT